MKYALQALELNVHIGITPEERSEPQLVLCDVDFEADSSKGASSDNITDVLNYQALYDAIKNVTEGDQQWNLLEKLHADIKSALSQFELGSVSVALTKFPFEDGAIMIRE